jgi:peptidoglycan hydrolase CwlO-like protein
MSKIIIAFFLFAKELKITYNYFMKELKEEEQWDKKKIILFVILFFVLVAIGYELKRNFLDKNSNSSPVGLAKNDVKGASTQAFSPVQSIKQNIQSQINSLRNEAQSINFVDIASSSSQVQKVINDLKALQNYPSNKLKDVCEKVCSGL